MVQAKKREVLLLADSEAGAGRRGKRRDSTERDRDRDGDRDRDRTGEEGALAYVHAVLPTDTITGVTIKYGCQAAVFRKANGFWPSDSIQSRRSVLLPVESCSVKGRPIDLLEGEGAGDVPTGTEDGDKIWKHESWVQIDGFGSPVQIGRVPRRALGFFPRTRRKSVSYDADGRESETTGPARRHGHGHQRRRSQLHLSGTGVGTLDRKSTAPGPALDGLSRFFAQHLPTISPTPTPTPTQTPEWSGLDNLGGAVEGWMRRMTNKARNSLADLNQVPSVNRRGDLIELDDSPDLPSSRSTSMQARGVTSRTRSRVKDD